MFRFKPTGSPEERSREVSQYRGCGSNTPVYYDISDGWLLVPEGDTDGLTQDEIDSLEEYTPPTEEI